MIRNLDQVDGTIEREADVVVIGGGTAGLVLAERLSRNRRVLVLESGPLNPPSEPSELDEVELAGEPYRAPREGRVRGLGGTSKIWGGALLPFHAYDFAARPELNRPAWPVPYDSVAKHFADVERLFGVPNGPYDQHLGDWPDCAGEVPPFIARYAKWPAFGKRNIASLLMPALTADKGPEIWLDATCTGFEFDGDTSRLKAVKAASRAESSIIARAKHFVLAAGAIESTRLLQWALDQPNAPQIPSALLGINLHDHVSARVADIETDRPEALNRLAGLQFEGASMRSFRLEPTQEKQQQLQIGGGFAHISFTSLRPASFDALRDIMRGVQARSIKLSDLVLAAADLPLLLKTAAWRVVHKRLYWPRPARYALNVVVEQTPISSNRITLANARDRFGVPIPRVDWRVSQADRDALQKLTECVGYFWRRSRLSAIGELKIPHPEAEASGNPDDVYHPGGTTPMGRTHADSVVDGDLAVWGAPNFSVLSTSTFPTGSSSNPTMTLLAFAFRLADHVEGRLGPTRVT